MALCGRGGPLSRVLDCFHSHRASADLHPSCAPDDAHDALRVRPANPSGEGTPSGPSGTPGSTPAGAGLRPGYRGAPLPSAQLRSFTQQQGCSAHDVPGSCLHHRPASAWRLALLSPLPRAHRQPLPCCFVRSALGRACLCGAWSAQTLSPFAHSRRLHALRGPSALSRHSLDAQLHQRRHRLLCSHAGHGLDSCSLCSQPVSPRDPRTPRRRHSLNRVCSHNPATRREHSPPRSRPACRNGSHRPASERARPHSHSRWRSSPHARPFPRS